MRESEGPLGDDEIQTDSRRLTPSPSSGPSADASNEDFLFHLYRGSELLQDNRVHEAKEELERALHLQPRDTKGQDLLAVVYFRLGHHARAIQIYEQLRRRNANDASLLLNLSLCYLKTGQPQAARRDLEHLVGLVPTHSRAWGYLGLALERLGEIEGAERAFQQGGHGQMARRMAARREGGAAAPLDDVAPSQEVRAVAGAAYRELDAGELSFALADPTSDRHAADTAAQSWQPLELGSRVDRAALAKRAVEGTPTAPPDTRDRSRPGPVDPPMAASVPQLGMPAANRRPTLIAPVGAPPAYGPAASELAAMDRIPSHQPPSFADDPPTPSYRHPVVSVPRPFGPPAHAAPPAGRDIPRRPTLSPALVAPMPPAEAIASPIAPTQGPPTPLGMGPRPPPTVEVTPPVQPDSVALRFPVQGIELHRSGVALVQTTDATGFVARLESIRTQQTGLTMELLERNVKGRANGESFGGVASPMVRASGAGQLILGARPGRKLYLFPVGTDMWFAREDVLLGFGGGLSFENGRLATGEGEFVPVVQLKGNGNVVLETIGEVLVLPVQAQKSLHVRREVVLGWFGRLVPRAVAPNVAPCGQRGLLAFAGEGHVLVTSA